MCASARRFLEKEVMRNLIIALIVVILLNFSGDAQKPKKDIFEFNKNIASHKIKLIFKTKPFNPKEHKIEEVRYEKEDWTILKIDGKVPLGADYSFIPTTEIEAVKLIWDGREIPVEKEIFADCYLPNFKKNYFWLKLSDDGESLMAFMSGGDAGVGYMVFWIFRKDGKHSRFSQSSPDGDYLNFASSFFSEE